MHYDLAVIGGGPGGYGAAMYAVKHGMSVALIERDRLGGTCLQRGCVPTQTYLQITEAHAAARPFAPNAAVPLDRRAMLARKNEIVAQLTQGIADRVMRTSIHLLEGTGTLLTNAGPFQIRIAKDGESQRLTADKVILATGGKPARLSLPGCNDPDVWTSDDLLGEAGAHPFRSLLIVGGGVIGVEMACVYTRLGVDVTLLETDKNCLPMMDQELSHGVELLLKDMGVRLMTDTRLQRIARDLQGFFVAILEKGGLQSVASERVLLATGRRPATEGSYMEDIAPAMNHGYWAVDEYYQTTLPGVYAVGAVNGISTLAHTAHAQGLAAVSHILGQKEPILTRLTPSCVYTTPEAASIGLTQEEAKAQGREVSVGKAHMAHNARSLIEGLSQGFIKLVVDQKTKQLLGAQIFCGRATDLLGELTLAISQGLSATELLRPMRAHPTFYEAVTQAVEAALK
ncbi:MAG: NAD(P)/FAD-dependent oxidoreductase [Clostridia bacterium]|nr:NAD(P)/FAD-dependent oxidoreductase [Clostridia bacterium]